VTSWAQYKAFTSHAERFNKAPDDVVTGGDKEPVKVTHGGPGTQAAGGGGSGGGAVGAGHDGPNGSEKESKGGEVRDSDVVDGHPKEFGRYRDDLWEKEDEKKRKEKEKEEKEKEDEKEYEGPIGNEGERRTPSSSDHGFHEWEKEEMEKLLQEVRGTLGQTAHLSF
jgi:phospholipase D1/2